jgi:hypothetical protein
MDKGRPSKYKEEYCDQIIEYFQKEPITCLYKEEYFKDGEIKSKSPIITANEFPTFQGFANKISVNGDTLVEWAKVNTGFSAAYARAKELQEHIWLVNGMQGLYNSQFAQFFGKNCLGYKDKTETDVTIKKDMTDEERKARIEELEKILESK